MFSLFSQPRSYPEFYEPWADQFNFYDGREAWEKSCMSIPQKAVHLYCVHWAHLEIYNGGFWQYFYNSMGVTAPEARDGFDAIGMPNVSNLFQYAMDMVGQPFPFDRDLRITIVGEPETRMAFEAENIRFDELADTPKIFRRQPRFVPFADAYAAKG